jgi:hypothetical protein
MCSVFVLLGLALGGRNEATFFLFISFWVSLCVGNYYWGFGGGGYVHNTAV